MTSDKMAIAKALRILAQHVETATLVSIESFKSKGESERDFIRELIQDDGYQSFAATGKRHVSIAISYCLPITEENHVSLPIKFGEWEQMLDRPNNAFQKGERLFGYRLVFDHGWWRLYRNRYNSFEQIGLMETPLPIPDAKKWANNIINSYNQ